MSPPPNEDRTMLTAAAVTATSSAAAGTAAFHHISPLAGLVVALLIMSFAFAVLILALRRRGSQQ